MAMATSYQRSILKTRKPEEVLISYLELFIFVQIFELFVFYFLTQSLKGVDFLKLPEQIQPDCNIVRVRG
jgi:hypothetical protein